MYAKTLFILLDVFFGIGAGITAVHKMGIATISHKYLDSVSELGLTMYMILGLTYFVVRIVFTILHNNNKVRMDKLDYRIKQENNAIERKKSRANIRKPE